VRRCSFRSRRCRFGHDDVMDETAPSRLVRVTLDCADADELAAFWARLLGWEVSARDGGGWVQLRDPRGGVGLNFQAEDWYEPPTWPERPGAQAKMVHFEVLVDDVEAAVRLVCGAGGSEAPHQPPGRDRSRLRVMLDPAGHPFCLFVRGE
jgi:catechol 2,3-dioxygenase-like lactoylglutathione lyase family enzyme